jgi:hypothetical protein
MREQTKVGLGLNAVLLIVWWPQIAPGFRAALNWVLG